MQKRISELKDHYIVCGLGDTGRYAVDELQKTGASYVVVEHTEENITKFREHEGKTYDEMLYVIGDATDEETLERAGIDRAKGLIAALATDKDNLVITVVVRQKSPSVRLVARCIDLKFVDKLLRAGANATVSPNRIGGLRLASEILRPHVVSFLDLMLKEHSRTLRIEEIEVGPASSWVGLKLEDLQFRKKYNLLPLAVKNAGAPFWANPPDNLAIQGGTVLVVMGDVNDVRRARSDAQHKAGHIMAGSTK